MAELEFEGFEGLAFIPHPPNAPMRETIEYLTDIIETHNGTEDRSPLRTKARQTFQYNVNADVWKIPGLFNVQEKAIRQRWAVPVWAEAQFVGNVHSGTINVDTTPTTFAVGGLAFVYSNNGFGLGVIETVTAGQIVIADFEGKYANAWVMPVRVAYLTGDIDRPSNGFNGVSAMTFEVIDTVATAEDVPTQYNGVDIYFDPPIKGSSQASRNISKLENRTDYDLGVVEISSPWTYSKNGLSFGKFTDGLDEMAAFKRFLARRMGKYREFYMPSFEHNVRFKSKLPTALQYEIHNDDFLSFTAKRNKLAIQYENGDWQTVVVDAAIVSTSETVVVQLADELNQPLQNIAQACYLGLYRLDTDRIEIDWIGNQCAEATFNLMEIAP